MKKLAMLLAVMCMSTVASALDTVGAGLGRWAFVITTAPHYPQDVWLAGIGNNSFGWWSGGSVCLRLGQGFEPGQSATFLTDVVSAGVYGQDGEPMPAFDGNGDPILYTAPSVEFGDYSFTIKPDETFFVIIDGYVVSSNIPGFDVGSTIELMFTWDYRLGRDAPNLVAWFPDANGDWFPFLNEGPMMTNVRWLR